MKTIALIHASCCDISLYLIRRLLSHVQTMHTSSFVEARLFCARDWGSVAFTCLLAYASNALGLEMVFFIQKSHLVQATWAISLSSVSVDDNCVFQNLLG
jgi:hypothetical protein